MKLVEIETRIVQMPLVAPFRTSFGTETVRELLVVRAETEDAVGWAECGTNEAPLYSSEYTAGASAVIEKFFVPALRTAQSEIGADFDAHRVGSILSPFKEHRLAKSAVETALLDAQLRAQGVTFASALGAVRDRVRCGVSLGIAASTEALLDDVAAALDAGYVRIKLKIEPGWDVAPVRAVRERFGDIDLQVDANAAYRRGDAGHLAKLDAFDLTLLEQPLPSDDLLGHAALAERIATPICLDESITSSRAAATAIALGACSIVNIKPGRVGGYLEARRIHDLCAAHDVPVWCGGMLETGIGRAANVAIAALPNFLLPGDTSASERYYAVDLTEPFRLDHGTIAVPQGPGIGVDPLPDVLESVTVRRERFAC
ncbi:O-succinylbenzoate synthase [Microbacterium mangrovi]|uniref:o-succinylbenzoate synthase n=1 Tax=Microbacterium mangrovi TaxID=1348253 RepID=A0A0B2A855_9MICO|nr:o-succinylbenzoate synthase [Microbacterium mangrovi]KHK97781.1 O-succinylbenzoate synthase [Microbacterium mangrovi]